MVFRGVGLGVHKDITEPLRPPLVINDDRFPIQIKDLNSTLKKKKNYKVKETTYCNCVRHSDHHNRLPYRRGNRWTRIANH